MGRHFLIVFQGDRPYFSSKWPVPLDTPQNMITRNPTKPVADHLKLGTFVHCRSNDAEQLLEVEQVEIINWDPQPTYGQMFYLSLKRSRFLDDIMGLIKSIPRSYARNNELWSPIDVISSPHFFQ